MLELSCGRGAVRRPVASLLTATNHYRSPEMAPLKGKFSPPPPFSCLSPHHFTEACSRARNQRLRQLAAGQDLAPQSLQRILGDPQIANPGTVGSAVFGSAESGWPKDGGPR